MIRIKISNIFIELPKELVAQIPYFNALSNEFYKNNKSTGESSDNSSTVSKNYIDINEPDISLSALARIIDLFQGKKLPMLKEYAPTFDFLGINYFIQPKKNSNKKKDISLYEHCNKYEFNHMMDAKHTHPIGPMENYKYKFIKNWMDGDVNVNSQISRIEIGHHCDIFDKFYIEIELPALPKGVYWKNKVGLRLLKQVLFKGAGEILASYTKDFFELEYYFSSGTDHWKIFDYSRKERILKSCKPNKIVIPLKICESKEYGFGLMFCTFTSVSLTIKLEEIKNLIEGDLCRNSIPLLPPPSAINKLTIYNAGIYLEPTEAREYFIRNTEEGTEVNFTRYEYFTYDLVDTDNFTIDTSQYLYSPVVRLFQVIIKIDGKIRPYPKSSPFEKMGRYYISDIYSSNVVLEMKLKRKKNYTVKVIIKYSQLLLYRGGMLKLYVNQSSRTLQDLLV